MRKTVLFISCLFLAGIAVLTGQQQADTTSYQTYFQQAEKYFNAPSPTDATDSLAFQHYQKAISKLLAKHTNDSLLVTCYTRLGVLLQAKNDDSAALNYFAAATNVKISNSHLPDSVFFKPLLFSGAAHYNQNNFDSALYYFKQADTIASKYPALDESERLYNKMGALYYQAGNYRQSINYFNKAISTLSTARSDYREVWVQYKINVGAANFKLKAYDQAMAIYEELLPYHSNSQPAILHNMGSVYMEEGNYQKALQTLIPLSYNPQVKLNDLARLYLALQQPDSAHVYLDSAVALNQKLNGSRKNISQGLAMKYYGDYYVARQDYTKAIAMYQQSVIQMDPDFFETDPYKNPLQFNGLHSSFNLFNALIAKAKAFALLYQQEKTSPSLVAALQAYKAAFALAQHVERFLDTDEARLFLKKNVEQEYANAIQTAVDVYALTQKKEYLEDAFVLSETNKASVLELNRQQLKIEEFAGVPQELVHEENNIKVNIASLTLQAAGSNDSVQTARLQQKIAEFEIQLSKLQEQLNENSRYYKLRYNGSALSVQKIQSEYLNRKTALVAYYFTAKQLITFIVTNNELNYVAAPLDSTLYNEITKARAALESPGVYEKAVAEASSKKLFHYLMEPVLNKTGTAKHLLIIPHNELHYIPFEILMNPVSSNYLVKDYAISYNYAASFLDKSNNNTSASNETLAFAPFASGSTAQDSSGNTFSVLPASGREVATLKGKVFTDTAATKNNFLTHASAYPVIHLATHAQANDQNPLESYIAFYPQQNNTALQCRLYEPEIYNLRLNNSKLVVLSACETGKGQLVSGEGVMSLSRAFSYAGCPAVITSLWKAEDNATAYLTQKLYRYLQKGYTKDEALQQAKIDYLEDDAIAPNFKTPNFWAHLILVGDAAPVTNSAMPYWYIIGGILVVLGVAANFRRRRLLTGNSKN